MLSEPYLVVRIFGSIKLVGAADLVFFLYVVVLVLVIDLPTLKLNDVYVCIIQLRLRGFLIDLLMHSYIHHIRIH